MKQALTDRFKARFGHAPRGGEEWLIEELAELHRKTDEHARSLLHPVPREPVVVSPPWMPAAMDPDWTLQEPIAAGARLDGHVATGQHGTASADLEKTPFRPLKTIPPKALPKAKRKK